MQLAGLAIRASGALLTKDLQRLRGTNKTGKKSKKNERVNLIKDPALSELRGINAERTKVYQIKKKLSYNDALTKTLLQYFHLPVALFLSAIGTALVN